MTNLSEGGAFALLERYRSHLIARARYEAALICEQVGSVTSRQVRERMSELGLMHPDIDERWLGCVFPGGIFESTGEKIEVQEASPRCRPGGGGGRPIKVWKQKPGVTTALNAPEWDGPDLHSVRTIPVPQPSLDEMRVALEELRTLVIGKTISPDLVKLGKWIARTCEGIE